MVLAGEEKLVSTCSKEYTTEGVFKNAALAKAAGKEKESNEVEAELESKKFSVVKKQRFEGVGSFSTAPLTGEPPKTVEYEILVKNESKAASITVESVTDANVPGLQQDGAVDRGSRGRRKGRLDLLERNTRPRARSRTPRS